MMISFDCSHSNEWTNTATYQPSTSVSVFYRVDPYREKDIDLVKNRPNGNKPNDPEYNQLSRAKKKGGRKRW